MIYRMDKKNAYLGHMKTPNIIYIIVYKKKRMKP